jgi:hypothetical protein
VNLENTGNTRREPGNTRRDPGNTWIVLEIHGITWIEGGVKGGTCPEIHKIFRSGTLGPHGIAGALV